MTYRVLFKVRVEEKAVPAIDIPVTRYITG
jgi:hypothetical protein